MIEIAAHWIVVLFAFWIIAVGALMLFRPALALHLLGRAASTNLINYLEITLRLIAGAAMVADAPHSRFPEILRIVGVFIVASSLILYFVPRPWHARYAVWWSKALAPFWVRILSPFAFAFGAGLIYAAL